MRLDQPVDLDGGAAEPRRQVGVVGAGTMGVGVAHAFAAAGHPVVLVDRAADALVAARRRIAVDARTKALFRTAATTPTDPDGLLQQITFTTDPDALAVVSYLVENTTERWPVKQQLYRQLDAICGKECVLAANTSAIPITKIAGATSRPESVIGNHFMNPAHLMPVVEVIRGVHTSGATVAASRGMLASIGKESIVVDDAPGFVTNRVLMLTINEAIFVLAEGVSTARDIDELFRRCLGHRMGPLETADLIGLDTVLYSLEVLLDELNDPKYRPCPLLRQRVHAGLLGRKTGQGFHRYPDLPASDAEKEISGDR